MWNLFDGIAEFRPIYFAKSKQIVYLTQKTENNVAKLANFAAGEIADTVSLPDLNKRPLISDGQAKGFQHTISDSGNSIDLEEIFALLQVPTNRLAALQEGKAE